MSVVERQVHGYRQGHQLLASSIPLPKEDQSVVDRLSDVAGPLRPREIFSPYITSYPLPSGHWVVLARTWQDLTVARAGCVRTLSLLIPARDWAEADGLTQFLELCSLDRLPEVSDATTIDLLAMPANPLPSVPDFGGSELLEALFLEEAKPVVVLDATDPELITTRLLTSLWPSLRRRFAISTFALSPRKVSGRDFDLVFAPKNARPKFADWNGRKVDGRSLQGNRHPWTGSIVSRVFQNPHPQLLSKSDAALVAVNDPGIDNAAALRIALLWDELVEKLTATPTAALGLLDIANSGKVQNGLALSAIEPSVADAARRALTAFPEAEAWSFLAALARKLQGSAMATARDAVAGSVEQLASRAPEGAINLLSQDDPRGIAKDLLPRIAAGITASFSGRAERALLSASPSVFGQLLAQDPGLMSRVADDRPLVSYLEHVLPKLDTATLDSVQTLLLPLLTEDWQAPAARPLLDRLDGSQLVDELRHLGEVNDFSSEQLSDLVLEKALNSVARVEVRSALSSLPSSTRRNGLIARTLTPSAQDAQWILTSDGLDETAVASMLRDLLRKADSRQFDSMIANDQVLKLMLSQLPTTSDIIQRAVSGDALPIANFLALLPAMFEALDGDPKIKLAKHAIRRCIEQKAGDCDSAFLASMLDKLGSSLNGAWFTEIAFGRSIGSASASRNMIAMNEAGQHARRQILSSIEDIAKAMLNRPSFDLSDEAVTAWASMMLDAERSNPKGLLRAAGHLIPVLLRLRTKQVSPMIAAAFPAIHRELAKADDVPDLFRFVPFLDWDRCKAARNELVDAFMSSSWPARDLALTACRADEVGRILARLAKQHGGKSYLKRMAVELNNLPSNCRSKVEAEISQILDDM